MVNICKSYFEINFSACAYNTGALRPRSTAFLPVEVQVEGALEAGAELSGNHLQLSSSPVSQGSVRLGRPKEVRTASLNAVKLTSERNLLEMTLIRTVLA